MRQYHFISTPEGIADFTIEYKSELKLSKFRRENMHKLAGPMSPSAKTGHDAKDR